MGDLNSILSAYLGGANNIAQPTQDAPAQTQAQPTLADIINQLMSQQSIASSAPGQASTQNNGTVQPATVASLNNMPLGLAPQSLLPSAGALNQQFLPVPQSIQAMKGQPNGSS